MLTAAKLVLPALAAALFVWGAAWCVVRTLRPQMADTAAVGGERPGSARPWRRWPGCCLMCVLQLVFCHAAQANNPGVGLAQAMEWQFYGNTDARALHRPGAVRLRHRRRICGAGIDDRVLSVVPGAASGRAFAGGRQLSAVGAGRAGAAVCRGGGIAVHPGQPPLGRAPGGADAGPADGQPGGCIFCRADDRKPVFAGDCALRAGVGSAAVGPLCGAGCAGWVVPRPGGLLLGLAALELAAAWRRGKRPRWQVSWLCWPRRRGWGCTLG